MTEVGDTVGRFQIRARLGKGGMGAVYAAFDAEKQENVALKVLLPEHANDVEARQRFKLEARILLEMKSHPGVVTAHEFVDSDKGVPFLVMELLAQGTLAEWIRQHRDQDVRICAIVIAQQIARTMADVHDKGFMHRDLKPKNILLVADERESLGLRPKVCDFGIAKARVSAEDYQGTTQYQTRGHIGTPIYSAPEQFGTEKVVDEKADVYTLGLILYEMLEGKRVFQSDDEFKEIYERNTLNVAPLRNVSGAIGAFVSRMLAKDPASRPSMHECADGLAKWGTDEPLRVAASPLGDRPGKTSVARTREKHASRSRRWWLLVVSVVVVAFVIGSAMVWKEKQATEHMREQGPIPSASPTLQASVATSAAAPARTWKSQFEDQLWDLRDDLKKKEKLRAFQYERLETVQRDEVANPGARRLDLAVILYELSEYERTYGTLQAAEKFANDAIVLVDDGLKRDPHNAELLSARAMSLSKRGKVWLARDKWLNAKADFEASIRDLKEIPKKSQEEWMTLATSRLELGQALLLGRDLEAAKNAFSVAMGLREEVADLTDEPYWKAMYAEAFLFRSKATKDPVMAISDLSEALKSANAALQQEDIWRHQAILARIHCEYGNVQQREGKLPDARQSYTAARSIAKQLVSDAPTHKDNALILIEALSGLEALNDPALAPKTLDERCVIARSFVKQDPGDERFVFRDCKQ